MRISVLSGKGGTGKTFISTNLVSTIGNVYIDCDVEEPNGAIFLKPEITGQKEVKVKIPQSDENCTGCKECVSFCRYHALAYAKDKLLVFHELCHSCGGCVMVCGHNALHETERRIGIIEYGKSQNTEFRHGILDSGNPSGVPIIKELLRDMDKDKIIVLDCPPGSSCTVMESIKDSDLCILAAEPTLFGIHNLNMVYRLTNLMDIPAGVIINKAVEGNTIVEEYCRSKNIPVIGKIPYNRQFDIWNSNGELVSQKQGCRQIFKQIYENILEVAANETAGSTKR